MSVEKNRLIKHGKTHIVLAEEPNPLSAKQEHCAF
jgi:hypothetical protein